MGIWFHLRQFRKWRSQVKCVWVPHVSWNLGLQWVSVTFDWTKTLTYRPNIQANTRRWKTEWHSRNFHDLFDRLGDRFGFMMTWRKESPSTTGLHGNVHQSAGLLTTVNNHLVPLFHAPYAQLRSLTLALYQPVMLEILVHKPGICNSPQLSLIA